MFYPVWSHETQERRIRLIKMDVTNIPSPVYPFRAGLTKLLSGVDMFSKI